MPGVTPAAAPSADATPVTGVYIHWPYCTRICPYCDFNVYKDRAIDARAWADALVSELTYWRTRTGPRRLASLYFGGGTPSLAPILVIEAVIDACDRLWGFEATPEITLEANPTSAEQARFEDFAKLGVNRLSLGVQSLRDDALRFLGREHSADEARKALARALNVFDRTTFDLIYARPDQSLDDWRDELSEGLALGASHLSLYQLTVEPGTAFERAVARQAWATPGDGLAADMFDLAGELTSAAGLAAYEISNHAAPGAQSQHNLIYWRQGDYIGAGPGAHGRLTLDGARLSFETMRRPQDYLAQSLEHGAALADEQILSLDDWWAEHLSMGLRLAEGTLIPPFFSDHLKATQPRLAPLIADGLLEQTGDRLRATPDGRRVLNAVLSHLLV